MSNGAPPHSVEVLEPAGRAWDHVKGMLFPFGFEKWLVLGFVAFLSAPYWHGGVPGKPHMPRARFDFPSRDVSHAAQYIEANLAVVAVALLIALGLYLIITYIGARALYVYMDDVARRRAALVEPWRRAGSFAGAFFVGRIAIDLAAALVLGGIFLAAALSAWSFLRVGVFAPEMVGIILIAGLLAVPLILFFLLVRWLYGNLVAPIMYLRGLGVLDAWRELLRLTAGNLPAFVLYALLNVAWVIGYIALAILAACCTCCIGLAPVIHQTLFQPLLLWYRAYPFYFLAQFGPPYAAPMPPVAPPPFAGGTAPMPSAPPVSAAPPSAPEVPAGAARPGVASTAAGSVSSPTPVVEPEPVAPPSAVPVAGRVVNCSHCGQPHQILGGPGYYICSRCAARFHAP